MNRAIPTLLAVLLSLAVTTGCEDDTDTGPQPPAPAASSPSGPASAPAGTGEPAPAALEGHYAGTIDYQGYEIEFDVASGQVQDLVGRVLLDCGYGLMDFTIAPSQPFMIGVDGSVAQTITDDYDGSQAEVELNGAFSGGTFTGYVREIESVDGTGSGCDTLQRTFTATLQ